MRISCLKIIKSKKKDQNLYEQLHYIIISTTVEMYECIKHKDRRNKLSWPICVTNAVWTQDTMSKWQDIEITSVV